MVIAKYQNELLVVWKDPVTRNRIVIGRLWKQDDLYHFEYVRDDEDERGSIEYAIEIWTKDKKYKLGYVPAVYSRYIDKLVEDNKYTAQISQIDRKADPYNIVKVDFTGKMVKPKVAKKDLRSQITIA